MIETRRLKNVVVFVQIMTYYYYKISSMYDVKVVSNKAEVLSVKDINE